MPHDLAFQADLSLRLVASALLGAALGLEREVHGHPAGMRTHMLVSLGSAIFTVLSIYGFPQVAGTGASDPSRIAAQIVSGIGFLGAGAIVKYGTNIRGLTTAASLWVVAAIGLACGAGDYLVAAVGTALAMLSLWPVNLLVQRLELGSARQVRLELALDRLDSFAEVSRILLERHVEIVAVQSDRTEGGQHVDLELRLPRTGMMHAVLAELDGLPGVDVKTLHETEEA